MRAIFVPASALLAKALAALVLAAPAAAQTGVDANPPPVPSGTLSSSEITAHFVASAIPNALYRDFAHTGTDPGLQAIAARELPKVEQTISALGAR